MTDYVLWFLAVIGSAGGVVVGAALVCGVMVCWRFRPQPGREED